MYKRNTYGRIRQAIFLRSFCTSAEFSSSGSIPWIISQSLRSSGPMTGSGWQRQDDDQGSDERLAAYEILVFLFSVSKVLFSHLKELDPKNGKLFSKKAGSPLSLVIPCWLSLA